MPTGHTDKETLTPYRASVLKQLPFDSRVFRFAKRHQINEMARFGWIEKDDHGYCRITQFGAAVLHDLGKQFEV